MKEIARPENGITKIKSVSLNVDIFIQCLQVTQLHDIDTENLSKFGRFPFSQNLEGQSWSKQLKIWYILYLLITDKWSVTIG
jgi:hypothetical protein